GCCLRPRVAPRARARAVAQRGRLPRRRKCPGRGGDPPGTAGSGCPDHAFLRRAGPLASHGTRRACLHRAPRFPLPCTRGAGRRRRDGGRSRARRRPLRSHFSGPARRGSGRTGDGAAPGALGAGTARSVVAVRGLRVPRAHGAARGRAPAGTAAAPAERGGAAGRALRPARGRRRARDRGGRADCARSPHAQHGARMSSTPIAVSFEFFPPTDAPMEATLWSSIGRLAPLAPRFVSVTYGADGSTRERTHRVVSRIQDETPLTGASHLTCVGAARAEILDI